MNDSSEANADWRDWLALHTRLIGTCALTDESGMTKRAEMDAELAGSTTSSIGRHHL